MPRSIFNTEKDADKRRPRSITLMSLSSEEQSDDDAGYSDISSSDTGDSRKSRT